MIEPLSTFRVLFNSVTLICHTGRIVWNRAHFLRSLGHDPRIMAGVRLFTPPIREIYAVLIQVGIVVVDD